MPRALKVYRTPIGFHDAYVAAPSKKAALAAWGTDRDLFARGAAELVTDEALTAEPLAHPGEVIRRSRGTTAEQIAALPEAAPKPRPSPGPAKPPKPAKTKSPSRAKLEAADAALAEVRTSFEAARRDLDERERALAKARRALEQKERRAVERARQRRDDAEQAYRDALDAWEG